jgi:DNA sulfur modification protein DndD
MIKIRRIKIENFRQFKNVEIVFDEDKGIFLFIGKNGIGKSNFLNAVCWCLYEEQPFKLQDQDKRLLNEDVFKKNPNSLISVEIEIISDGDVYLIRRSKAEIQNSRFVIMKKNGEDWKEIENPTYIRENFLPKKIMNFFFFDGEAIQNLFKGEYSKNIRDSVWKVSDVEIIENALDHLNSIYDDLRKKLTKDTPHEKKKEEELTIIEEGVDKNIKELEEKRLLLEKLKEDLVRLKKEEEHHIKYKSLHQRRSELENQLQELEMRGKEDQRDLNLLICNLGPFYYSKDAIVEVGSFVGKDIDEGEIPSDIKGKFILDLINRKRCICGHSIIEGEVEYRELKKLLDIAESKEEREILLKDTYFIDNILNDLKLLPDNIRKLREKKAKVRQEINKTQIQIRDIKEQLKNAPDKEVGDIEKTIEYTESNVFDCLKEMAIMESEIKSAKDRIKDILNEINEEISKKDKSDKIKKEYDLIVKSIEFLKKIKEKIIRQVGAGVSMKTDAYFKELIWKKGEFEKIQFDDNYQISVYKKGNDNTSTLRDLSTGELKVLGFATLKALAEISGFREVPVFIDGPLEYLDKEVQSSFLKYLPNFMPEKQVFIFSVDRESILDFSKNIKPSNLFKLERKEGSYSTEITSFN